MSDEKKPCIYKIENKSNGKFYIGKASYPDSRFRSHRSKLNRGVHANSHLQKSWDKYGENQFIFEVVLFCEYDDMPYYEENLIKSYGTLNSSEGYNMVKEIGDNRVMPEESREKLKGPRPNMSGKDNPMYGVERSEEVKEAIREAQTGREHSEEEIRKRIESMPDYSGENNPMYGVTGEDHPRYGEEHTKEAKRKLSEAHKNKEGMKGEENPRSVLSDKEVKKIKKQLVKGLSHHDISEDFDCSRSVISQISRGEIWEHIDVEGNIGSSDNRYSNPGSDHPNSKLDEEDVRKIKSLLSNSDLLLKKIADQFNVSINTISSIKNKKSWTHVKMEGEK